MKSSYTHVGSLTLGIESDLNLLYFNVYSDKKGRRKKSELDYSYISNVAIYNCETETTNYLFEKGSQQKIVHFLYENNYNEETGAMEFNGLYTHFVMRNKIPKRACSNTLLIVTKDTDKELLTFWKATKMGENLRRIKTISQTVEWRLDVSNQKILFVTRIPNEVIVETIDW